MDFHHSIKFDPNAGPLTVKLVRPVRAASQLDLWSHGLMSEFCVNQDDPNKNRSQTWNFDPRYWSQHGDVLECWGINSERRFENGEEFEATLEIFQASILLASVTRTIKVEDNDAGFSVRVRFISIDSMDEYEESYDYVEDEAK